MTTLAESLAKIDAMSREELMATFTRGAAWLWDREMRGETDTEYEFNFARWSRANERLIGLDHIAAAVPHQPALGGEL